MLQLYWRKKLAAYLRQVYFGYPKLYHYMMGLEYSDLLGWTVPHRIEFEGHIAYAAFYPENIWHGEFLDMYAGVGVFHVSVFSMLSS